MHVHATGTCDHFKNSSIMVLDPQNIGLEALFAHLSAILGEMEKIDFWIMVALICIKMVDGTLCQLFNIAHHFQHIFSIQETLIRSIFPGGAWTPSSATRLITLEKKWGFNIQ